jgi:hypothetical protein
MQGVSESLAGRVAVFQLLPMSIREHAGVAPVLGGFPEVLARPRVSGTWFRSYVQTYLERDVRAVTGVRDLATFRRFLALVASRCGQVLNKTDLAAPLGVSVPTITEWLSVLEVTGQTLVVPPFFENFGKRLIKSPKLYFADSGLLCHLLGVESETTLTSSPFLGAVFESFVAAEIAKRQAALGRRREVYYFRDQQGLEVDFVIPAAHNELLLIEAKASRTATPDMASSAERLAKVISRYKVRLLVVHRPTKATRDLTVLAPGVSAVDVGGMIDAMTRLAGPLGCT